MLCSIHNIVNSRYSKVTMTLLQALPLLIEDSAGMIESSSSLDTSIHKYTKGQQHKYTLTKRNISKWIDLKSNLV